MMRALLMAGLLVAPAMAQDRRQALGPAMLDVHNAARAAFGAAPLTWNIALALDAETYAKRLALTQLFAHDPRRRNPVQGENLYMGTRGGWTFIGMAQLWVDERRDFRPGRFPE